MHQIKWKTDEDNKISEVVISEEIKRKVEERQGKHTYF